MDYATRMLKDTKDTLVRNTWIRIDTILAFSARTNRINPFRSDPLRRSLESDNRKANEGMTKREKEREGKDGKRKKEREK